MIINIDFDLTYWYKFFFGWCNYYYVIHERRSPYSLKHMNPEILC